MATAAFRATVAAALTLVLLARDLRGARGGYCDTAFVWLPNGTRVRSATWNSTGGSSRFAMGPCLSVSGIGAQVTHRKTLLVLDRVGASNGYVNVPGTSNLAFGQEANLRTGAQRGLDVMTNTFCSSGQFTSDGTFLSIGGDSTYGSGSEYTGSGIGSVRAFTPCTDATCKFSIPSELDRGRWYPSTQILGDGRVVVVGGSIGGTGLNSKDLNVPYIEYIPKLPRGPVFLQFLVDTLPYNLFPFVHLLPSGRLFIFAGTKYVLFDTGRNRVVAGARPELVRFNADGKQLFWQYPLTGTSALMPLSPGLRYRAEVVICGGTSTQAFDEKTSDENAPASAACFRIYPDQRVAAWSEMPPMASPRVMPMAVLLPDSNLLIHGGAARGWAGLGRTCHDAVLQPETWNPFRRFWYSRSSYATSLVPRVYHASAMLTAGGSVLVTGSNPHSSIVINGDDFPTEFRSEYFHPPYTRSRRPVITAAPDRIPVRTLFEVRFTSRTARKVSAVLTHPGFSTHSQSHGMRNVQLEVKNVTRVNGAANAWTAWLAAPPNKTIAPPTWYWLWILENSVPNTEGFVTFVQ